MYMYYIFFFPPPPLSLSWFISKHSKPLKEELVRFPPYPESRDRYRGSTVIPYLEAFYNYEGVSGLEATGRWDSQDEEALFDTQESSTGIPSATQSLASVSHERSLDTIASRKSRVHSQENGEEERGRAIFTPKIFITFSYTY